jgi:hypothetical protein
MMRRLLSGSLAVLLIIVLNPPLSATSPEPTSAPDSMTLWEAYSRGVISIQQVDLEYELGGIKDTAPLGYRVSNSGTVEVRIDEYAMLLSPSPGESAGLTTQDGVLTKAEVPATGEFTYGWGDLVAQGVLNHSPWWCTEEYQSVRAGVYVALGGEILPFAAEPIVETTTPPPGGTQDSLWLHLKTQPTLVVGKTVDGAFWREISSTAGQSLQVVLRATNLAINDGGVDPGAPSARVWDTIPPGFSVDPASITPGFAKTSNPDGSTTLEWVVNLPAAEVAASSPTGAPTPYESRTFSYRMTTPDLPPGRITLPRAQVSVTDDGTAEAHSAQPLLDVLPGNEPPLANAGGAYQGPEGSPITFSAAASSDPDGDSLSYRWDFQADGLWDTPWSSDPTASHTYGDDFSGVVRVEVSDGAHASAAEASVIVTNVAPSVALSLLPYGTESEALLFQVQATDPGSDDLSLSWWGQCSGWSSSVIAYPNDPTSFPDPYPSPQVHPRDVTDTQAVVCGDDGTYQWEVKVEDDDAGLSTLGGTFQVDNLPPSLTVSPPSIVQVDEGTSVTLDATASDPGSDDLTFTWQWDHGPAETRSYYNDGSGPDPQNSPDGAFPFTASDSSTWTYGDDCLCIVTLTVTDDDGGVLTYSTTVEVLNAPPSIEGDVRALITANLTLRVAGERFHDVVLAIYESGTEVAAATVYRVPGDPDAQAATIEDVTIDLLSDSTWSARIEYTPLDDAVNGQVWGADPAWLVFTLPSGEESRIHHAFNVRHEDTWIWEVPDLAAFLVGLPITFVATASDPGSDDLTFTWSWGDATADTATTYYNDGIGPDPYPSPEVNPVAVTDAATHLFGTQGTFPVSLTVEDDDGGAASLSVVISA